MPPLLRAAADWLGRKGLGFVFAVLTLLIVALAKDPPSTEAYGLWVTGLYGAFVTGNAAVTIGTKGKPPATGSQV